MRLQLTDQRTGQIRVSGSIVAKDVEASALAVGTEPGLAQQAVDFGEGVRELGSNSGELFRRSRA